MSPGNRKPGRPFKYVGPRGETGPQGPAGADASGDVVASGTLTANAVIVGNGGVGVKALASLGTTGQVLKSAGAGSPPAFGDLAAAGWAFLTNTDTGAQNGWAPGTLTTNTLVKWNGASDATINGLAGGSSGYTVLVRNITAAKVAYFTHQNGGATATKFKNAATSGATPLAPGGWLAYAHDGTDWLIIGHDQGLGITPTFAAGDFTASGSMTWTVDAGDVVSYSYKLDGKWLRVIFDIITTTVGGTLSNNLRIKIPGGYTNRTYALSVSLNYSDNGSGNTAGFVQVGAGNTYIECYKFNVANWSAATNATGVYGEIFIEVD